MCRIQYRSDNPDRGVPVGIEELPSPAVEHSMGGIECGKK